MGNLPAPLTPPGSTVKKQPFVIDRKRLENSRAASLARRQPELMYYMENLWEAAWQSIPAASLDDDDARLCDFAKCDPARWPAVRDGVTRGFVKCDDGRLYHPVVAEMALNAIKRREYKTAHMSKTRKTLKKQVESPCVDIHMLSTCCPHDEVEAPKGQVVEIAEQNAIVDVHTLSTSCPQNLPLDLFGTPIALKSPDSLTYLLKEESKEARKQESKQAPPETKKAPPKKAGKDVSSLRKSDEPEVPAWMPLEQWNAFCDMRRGDKQFTAHARKMIFTRLNKFRCDGVDIATVLEDSVISGWRGVFAPKFQPKQKTSRRYSPGPKGALEVFGLLDEPADEEG